MFTGLQVYVTQTIHMYLVWSTNYLFIQCENISKKHGNFNVIFTVAKIQNVNTFKHIWSFNIAFWKVFGHMSL